MNRESLRRLVADLIFEERNSPRPERQLPSMAGVNFVGASQRGAPVAPFQFFARLRSRTEAIVDGTFPPTEGISGLPVSAAHMDDSAAAVRDGKKDASDVHRQQVPFYRAG